MFEERIAAMNQRTEEAIENEPFSRKGLLKFAFL